MPLTRELEIALPKGRLEEPIRQYLAEKGFTIHFEKRQLVMQDEKGELRVFLVKSSDLPTYVHHGIAGLGICGEDLLYEANLPLYKLMELPFGSTRLCLAAREDDEFHQQGLDHTHIRVVSKFTRFARDYFHKRNISVDIIKLNGSVELAAVLGLAPYIIDLVETGETLKANKLKILEELKIIRVCVVANPAYYKYHYKQIWRFLEKLQG